MAEPVHRGHHAARGQIAGLVGHRMARLDDLDLAGRDRVAVAGDDEAADRLPQACSKARAIWAEALPAPMTIGAAGGAVGQMGGNGAAGISRRNGGAKQVDQQVALHIRHNAGNAGRRLVAVGEGRRGNTSVY